MILSTFFRRNPYLERRWTEDPINLKLIPYLKELGNNKWMLFAAPPPKSVSFRDLCQRIYGWNSMILGFASSFNPVFKVHEWEPKYNRRDLLLLTATAGWWVYGLHTLSVHLHKYMKFSIIKAFLIAQQKLTLFIMDWSFKGPGVATESQGELEKCSFQLQGWMCGLNKCSA